MRKLLFYIILLFPLDLPGQIFDQNDTIPIGEVIIKGKEYTSPSSGYKTVTIDSSVLQKYTQRSVAELISDNSTVYIKSYGPGGISTPSFRGTNAGHTQITWNGIDINNPMPGQFDLSLLPAGFIDGVSIYYGGSSMEIDNGGIGGIVDLETGPQWKADHNVSVNMQAGSYGRYSGLIKLNAGSDRFRSSTKAFFRNSENNFRYLNTAKGPEGEWERRENSWTQQKGLMQELFLKNKNNSIVSGRFWYQATDRNLPVPITVEPAYPPEKQNDESFRAMFSYEKPANGTDIKVTAAAFQNKLRYLNELTDTDSRNISDIFILKSEFESDLNSKTRLKIDFKDQLSVIKSNNYNENRNRNLANASIMTETNLKRLVARILLRGSLLDNKLLVPDFSAATQIHLARTGDYFFKANLSRNSKIPSLNDMYWSPGGNPDLKNENAWLFEIGWEMTEKINSSLKIRNELTLFKNLIDNLIQWHPGNGTFWVADNLRKATTAGFETGLSLLYYSPGLNAQLKAEYAYIKAVYADHQEITMNETVGKQIVYVPAHKLNILAKTEWKHLYSSLNTSFISRRFLTADNSQYLPGYTLCDFTLGWLLNTGKTSWNVNFNVDNLFNQSYQNVAWYPMPGRSYSISLLIQLPV